MTNQTTDEAAVDIVWRLLNDDDLYTRDVAASIIETLRAQLTAATRRAEQAEQDAADRKAEADQWQAKGFEHEAKLEQAERMLAEVQAILQKAHRDGLPETRAGRGIILGQASDKILTAIRSAASGEQG